MINDIKTWLETTGEEVAETAFTDAVPLPFIVFADRKKRGGADLKNLISTHNVTVERYTEDGVSSGLIEAMLDAEAIEYETETVWIDDEQCYMTTYDFEFTATN